MRTIQLRFHEKNQIIVELKITGKFSLQRLLLPLLIIVFKFSTFLGVQKKLTQTKTIKGATKLTKLKKDDIKVKSN